MPFFWSYLSHFILDFDGVKCKVGLLNPCNLSNYLASPPASLPEMTWLAMIFLWYRNHCKLDFVGVKSKIGLPNFHNSNQILINPTYQTKSTKKKLPWGLNQTYWTKFTKPNLKNQINLAKCLKCKEPNIPNQIISIKLTKQNPLYQFYKTRSWETKYTENQSKVQF